jgi:hypothetical protein
MSDLKAAAAALMADTDSWQAACRERDLDPTDPIWALVAAYDANCVMPSERLIGDQAIPPRPQVRGFSRRFR